jgi:hypothetical protein
MAGIPPHHSPGISPSSLNALRAGAIVLLVTLGVLLLMYYRAKLVVRNEVRDYLISVASIAASMVEGDLHESFTSPDQESSAACISAVEPLARVLG